MKKKNNKQIVFLTEEPENYTFKLAYSLKKRGYKTCLYAISFKDKLDYSFYSEAFDKIICMDFSFRKKYLKNLEFILRKMPLVFKFFFSLRFVNSDVIIGVSNNNWTIALSKIIMKNIPFIYVPYDITALRYPELNKALEKKYKFELKAEKFCFETSDGLMVKYGDKVFDSLGNTYLENLKLPENRISFLPYCLNEFIVPINKNKLSNKDNEYHLVSVGGTTFRGDSDYFLKCLDIITKQKIHLHFYTQNPEGNKIFKNFSNNKFIHIHKPLSYKDLTEEISMYDFAIWFDTLPFNNEDNLYMTALRVSTFLEAGLPFFYNPGFSFIDGIMKSYNIGLGIKMDKIKNFTNLRKRIEKLNYKKLEKNVIKARKDFNFDKHFPRLENFVEEVAKRRKLKSPS